MEARRPILKRMIVGVAIGTVLSIACAALGPAIFNPASRNSGARWATLQETWIWTIWRDAVDENARDGAVAVAAVKSLSFRVNDYNRGAIDGGYCYYDGEIVYVESGWPARSVSGWSLRSSTIPTLVVSSDGPPPKLEDIDARSVPAVSSSCGMIALEPGAPGVSNTARIVFTPIPLGLLINAATWSAPICLLLLLTRESRRGMRRRLGLCMHCGYDLSATPDGNPCPECGHQSRVSQ